MSTRVKFDTQALRATRWYEYAMRFAFGGIVSVVAGLVGHYCGLVVGGVLLAFPAILPASLTLVEEHAGRRKASDDASGAARGAVGLAAFAICVWCSAGRYPLPLVLASATAVWLVVSVLLWCVLTSGSETETTSRP